MSDNDTTLSPRQTALARHHTYVLLGALLREGLTTELLPYAQAVPELTAVLPQPFNADRAAAAHQDLFRFNLFPHEAIFLGTDGLLGGPVTGRVTAAYREAGFAVADDGSSPDHVGHELALLAVLCGAEADAWEDEHSQVAAQMRQRQHAFLGAHLLRWLFPLVLAVRQQGDPFYTAVANLTADLVTAHFLELNDSGALIAGARRAVPLPQVPDILQEEKTGLKQIAAFLITPVYSGFYLSRADVGRLARTQRLPRGFGKRSLMLHNLLQSAVQYDSLPALLAEVAARLQQWEAGYADFAQQDPRLAPFLQPWRERVQNSIALLAQIAQSAGELAS